MRDVDQQLAPDRVTRLARWSIGTPIVGWVVLALNPTVQVIPVTLACALVAACLVLIFPTALAARQAIQEGRRMAVVGTLIGGILCGITGFGGLAILVVEGAKSGGPWREGRSLGWLLIALLLCGAYFVPLFRLLLSRPSSSRGYLAGALVLVLLAVAAPLPIVSDTWTRVLEPELWRAREKRRAYSDFLEERGYWDGAQAHPSSAVGLRIPDGKVLDRSAVEWLAEHFPDDALTLELRSGARVDPEALDMLPALDVRACSYSPPDPDGAFLKAIAACPNLEELKLYGFSRHALPLEPLAAAGRLHSIEIKRSPQSDEELKVFGSLKNLESLRLSGSLRLTDEGLRHFAGLRRLRELELTHHRIAGPGLRHLHGLKNLRLVRIGSGGGVDRVSVEELRAALPDCVVQIGE